MIKFKGNLLKVLLIIVIINPISCKQMVIDYTDRSNGEVIYTNDNSEEISSNANEATVVLYHEEYIKNQEGGGCASAKIKRLDIQQSIKIGYSGFDRFSSADVTQTISKDKYKPDTEVESCLYYTVSNTGTVDIDNYKFVIRPPKFFKFKKINVFNFGGGFEPAYEVKNDKQGNSVIYCSIDKPINTGKFHAFLVIGTYKIPEISEKKEIKAN